MKNNKKRLSSARVSKIDKKNNPLSRLSEFDSTTRRFQIAAGIFLLAWALLWFRAFYVQLIKGPTYAKMASRQHMETELVEARRGTIYDRNGQVLASSIDARSIWANPREMKGTGNEVARILAPIINENEETLRALFARDKAFVWVKRKVDDATVKAIQEAGLTGIGLLREYDRIYPQKHLAGQLIGFVGIDNTGLEGVERAFNTELAGESMERVVYKDGQGRRYYMDGQDAPVGKDLHLTIDGQIQYIAEEVIAKASIETMSRWGGVLIVETQTGDIVAWAQYPFFNPNSFRTSSPEIYRNRIAADALEPGSTLKAFPVAAALEEGVIEHDSVFYCEDGTWEMEHLTIRDDGRVYQDLTVDDIIRYSSNIGVAKVGLELGKNKYQNYLSRLGFGKRTGIGIAESRGILRDAWEWSEIDLMSAAFGQSVAVTGVQMAQAYLTLANHGVAKPVRLIIEDSPKPAAEQRIFSQKTTREVMSMLEAVVDGDGTGRRARVTGVRVAGKTGTAQKASQTSAGYGEGRFASFTGIVPADKPRYVIIIMLDEPQTTQYGGTIAAPVFSEVASRVLAYGGYMPDVVFAEANNVFDRNKELDDTPLVFSTDTSGTMKTFPNLIGANIRQALEVLIPLGIEPEIRGKGLNVLYQYPAPQTQLPLKDAEGKAIPCVLWLSKPEELTQSTQASL